MKAVTHGMTVNAKDGNDGGTLCGVSPIALNAQQIVATVFPFLGLRSWRTKDYAGKIPAGFDVGGKRVWRMRDLERWAEMGFPDRREFEARLGANGGS